MKESHKVAIGVGATIAAVVVAMGWIFHNQAAQALRMAGIDVTQNINFVSGQVPPGDVLGGATSSTWQAAQAALTNNGTLFQNPDPNKVTGVGVDQVQVGWFGAPSHIIFAVSQNDQTTYVSTTWQSVDGNWLMTHVDP